MIEKEAQAMKKRMKKSGFTLVELLVTVGIIAILAAILLPVVTKVFTVAEKNKAHLQALEIKKSVDAFYAAYNRPPIDFETFANAGTKDTDFDSAFSVSENERIIKALIGNDDAESRKINPRGTVFLAIKAEVDCGSGDIEDGEFFDPWCQQYGIMLDKDGDGKIKFEGKTRITRCIAISKGPNGVADDPNNKDDNITSEDT
jgi:prepilin-type N-terminal cleavage/methylation domain-containing protein